MGLPAALKAHKEGNRKLAAIHYQRALDQNDTTDIIYQNFGSLLKDAGDLAKAKAIYEQGLALYPKHNGIRKNYSNLIKPDFPLTSLDIQLAIVRDTLGSNSEKISTSLFYEPLHILDELNYHAWAYNLCRYALQIVNPDATILASLFKIATNPSFIALENFDTSHLADLIQSHLNELEPLDQASFFYSKCWVELRRGEVESAKGSFYKARDLLSLVNTSDPEIMDRVTTLLNTHSWNTGCMLLSLQQFEEGWKLFEYGLRTAAKGPQKWQRAMPKPFTNLQIGLWRGEDLSGKKILLLEEQAIGDVMQFITLLPSLFNEAAHIGLLLNNRLLTIYRRSLSKYIHSGQLSIFSFEDIQNQSLNPGDYDFQSPIGSVCQYRFIDLGSYSPLSPVLISNEAFASELRSKYFSSGNPVRKIIGVSWRGGGTGDRIKEKSVPLNLFKQLLKDIPDFRFVSLQYGQSKEIVDQWRNDGIDIIHDDSINPLKNMDDWIAQVAACDAVLSVANTTIHGAGGLNLPTLCLLSLNSDWRWLRNPAVKRSYWYPSVGIARQDENSGWTSALHQSRNWLLSGCPQPSGPCSV